MLGINPTWSQRMTFLIYCGFSLSISCWGFLHICSSEILTCSSLFLCVFICFWNQGNAALVEWMWKFSLLLYIFLEKFENRYWLFFFSIYEIYCQIGLHTTPSAHPKRCPPQCLPPTFPSLPPPHQPSVYSQFSRVSYGLDPSLSNLFFFLPLPRGLLLSFSGST